MMSWIVNASPVKWQTPTLDMSTARLAKLKLYRWPHHSRPNGSASEMRSKPRLSLRGRTLIAIRGRLQTWQDKAGNATPLTDFDPINNSTVTFTNLQTRQPELLQANLIMPEPCIFLNRNLPACAIIRPTGAGQLDARGVINSFIADGLFRGQPPAFLTLINSLAQAADAAQRE
jgi:hypothetical protein